MPAQSTSSTRLKAVISVSEMAKLLGMSRANFYALVDRGVFCPPVYCVVTRRPFFTAEMQADNLMARQTGIGVHGQYVLFYERAERADDGPVASRRRTPASREQSGLLSGLKSLGLQSVTAAQVTTAMGECFPDGAEDIPESDVLRAVYRHLRRSGAA